MEILNATTGVDYNNGYFVIYKRKVSPESGKLAKWSISETYATPVIAVKAKTEYAALIPLWEESKRKASIRKPKPDHFS
jgi:hypothetical protein